PGSGDVAGRSEQREERARPLGDRLPYRVVAGEVEQHRAFAVVEEMGRHDDGQVSAGAGRDELPEVVRLEELAPLRVVERGVVLADQHARMMPGPWSPLGLARSVKRRRVALGCV